jgi:hypothetical protein
VTQRGLRGATPEGDITVDERILELLTRAAEREAAVIQAYLPGAASADDMARAVEEGIAETGAASPRLPVTSVSRSFSAVFAIRSAPSRSASRALSASIRSRSIRCTIVIEVTGAL